MYKFYYRLLSGERSDESFDDILAEHSRLYTMRKKARGLPDLTRGKKQHNLLVVDWIMAVILKKIGWSGKYLHAWPGPNNEVFHADDAETFACANSWVPTL